MILIGLYFMKNKAKESKVAGQLTMIKYSITDTGSGTTKHRTGRPGVGVPQVIPVSRSADQSLQ
jgi:hypothetical protein